MMPATGYLVGSACYGLAAAFAIRFSDRLSVASAAAFAPAVAWSAFSLDRPVLLMVPPLFGMLALLIRRRPWREVTWQALLFALSAIAIFALRLANVVDILLPILVSGAVYLVGDFVRQRLSASAQVRGVGVDRRTWWLLQGVLLCACGLTGLGVEQMDWPAFAAMAGVLVVTKHEFEAFAKSRKAYEQTVRAVEKLQQQDATVWKARARRQL